MNSIRIAGLALALSTFALVMSETPAMARGSFGSPHQWCHWYKQKAMSTGQEIWWVRWRKCIRGNYWD